MNTKTHECIALALISTSTSVMFISCRKQCAIWLAGPEESSVRARHHCGLPYCHARANFSLSIFYFKYACVAIHVASCTELDIKEKACHFYAR